MTAQITITADTEGVTLVNVYDVAPGGAQALVARLEEVTRDVIAAEPGFVSVSLHVALDGTKVVNYAQWASAGAFQAFMAKPETRDMLGGFAALATSVSPGLYHVAGVVTA